MAKTKFLFVGLAVVLVGFLFAGSSSAQDGPTLTADPAMVESAGEHTITVTASGFTASPPFAVLPCPMPDSGNPADVDSNACNLGMMTMIGALEDGGFTTEITLDVPEEGIVIAAGDIGQSQGASVAITIGMMDSTGGMGMDGELPNTGSNTSLLVVIGIGMALSGVMVLGLSRRLRTQ